MIVSYKSSDGRMNNIHFNDIKSLKLVSDAGVKVILKSADTEVEVEVVSLQVDDNNIAGAYKPYN